MATKIERQPAQTTVLITGAASGFGHDASLALAHLGYQVLATTETGLQAERLQKEFKRQQLPIQAFKLDVTDAADRDLVSRLAIDILINNAGIGESGPLAEIPLDRVRGNFETNVFGPLALTQLALPGMIARRYGKIIFISSLAGRGAIPFLGAYCMTKFAISCEAEAMRRELAMLDDNIWVSVVEPGAYHTGFNQRMFATKYQWLGPRAIFCPLLPALRQKEERRFALIEVASTKSLVDQIVKAVRSPRPKLRYSAPWWQAWSVNLQRIMGK